MKQPTRRHRIELFARVLLAIAFSILPISSHAAEARVLVKKSSEWRFFKGTEEPDSKDLKWWDKDFRDSHWSRSSAPFRYGDGGGGTRLNNMSRSFSTLYLRHSFSVTNVGDLSALDLSVDFDDGFIAWINGTIVQSVNAPTNPKFNDFSTASHESGVFETFDLGNINSLLTTETNVIAIQAFNVNLTSTDFLIDAELIGIPKDTEAPRVISISPRPGAVESLNAIELLFNEPVKGIDPSDLLLNGEPARFVQGQGKRWTFGFSRIGFGPALLTWNDRPQIQDLARPGNDIAPSSKSEVHAYQIVDETRPELRSITPPPGTTVSHFKAMELFFSEPITGFDPNDIQINGRPASTVSGFADGPWIVTTHEIESGPVTIEWTKEHGILDTSPTPNDFRPKAWSYQVDTQHALANVTINEFLTSNQTGIKDEDGFTQDWIEIKNKGRRPIDLNGWSLSDDKKQPSKWLFPSVSLASGDYLLVFASGKDRRDPKSNLHTNFKLRSKKGFLGLFNSHWPRQEIDGTSPKYPLQRADISYGINHAGQRAFFTVPTPGSKNTPNGFDLILSKPLITKSDRFFTQPFSIRIHSDNSNSVIRYTTDYSEPTKSNGKIYRKPITINQTTVIRAAAFVDDALPSEVVTKTYVYSDTLEIQSLPIISLATDARHLWGDSGILERNPHNTRNRGIDWERPVSAELLAPDIKNGLFQINAGLRVQGGDYIRHHYRPNTAPPTGKYGLRLYFRGQYGESQLNHAIFPRVRRDQFEHLVLRAGMNDPINPFIVDELIRRLNADMGQAASQGTIVNLLLNGDYQGYYNPTERIDEHFLQSRHGGGTQWDIIAQRGEIRAGDDIGWKRFEQTMTSLDLSIPDHYSRITQQLDIDNFIDYIMLNVYVDMDDWPENNWRAARERIPGAMWRFYIWDGERAFGTEGKRDLGTLSSQRWPQKRTVESNNLTRGPLAGSSFIARLFRSLLNNSEFRLRFADRVNKHYFNGGALTQENILARYSELRDLMKGVLPNINPYIEREWIPKREAVVMKQMESIDIQRSMNAPRFNQHGGEVPDGFLLSIKAQDGTLFFTTDGSDPKLNSIVTSPNKSDQSFEIQQSVTVKARSLFKSQWSALTEASFTIKGEDFPVVITEIMSLPSGGNEYEFVELLNFSDQEIDLSSHRLKGIDFTFKLGTRVAPSERFVLASNKDPEAFKRRYRDLEVRDWFDGTLNNKGEQLSLVDGKGKILLSLDMTHLFRRLSLVEGHSLELHSPKKSSSSPTHWRSSPQLGGSPGR